MAKLYFVKVTSVAADLRDQNRPRQAWQTQVKHKKLYFRSRVTVRKPISTKLGMCIEDVRTNFCADFLGSRGEMTDALFFGYKSLIYEPNLAKFLTNVRTQTLKISWISVEVVAPKG